jgi:heat shock protein HslJ
MKATAAAFAILAAACVASCATTNKDPPPKPFVGTYWMVVLELPPPGEQPWIRFGDGRMEGFGGCNRIAARYVQDSVGSKAIAIGRIETGRHACDARAQAAEDHVLGVLQMASSYAVIGDVLAMTGSAGTLRFKAVTPQR